MTTHALDPALAARARGRAGTRLAAVVALLGLEVVLGQLSVYFAPPGSSVAAYWPNAGISVIALCIALPRWRPAVLGGIFAVTTAANLLAGRPLDVSLGFAVVNVVEAGVVLWVLTRTEDHSLRLANLEDFIRLLAGAVLGATASGILGGAMLAWLTGADWLITWRALFTSHAASILILTPLVMDLPRQRRESGAMGATVQWTLLLVTTVAVFAPSEALPLTFLTYPLLVWGAILLSPREVSFQVVAYGVLVSALTTAGHGPFVASVVGTTHAPEMIGTLLQANVVGAALVALPLTLVKAQQVHTLDQLTDSHEVVTSILDATTGTAILGTSLEGHIQFFNVGAERMTGYNAEEVIHNSTIEVSSGPMGEPILGIALGQEPDTEALDGLVDPFLDASPEGVFTMDWNFRRKNGDMLTASVAIARRYDARGEHIGYLGVAEDVTERRKQEATVAAALESEKQIVERLAQVDQTKNDFLSTVSHELRTPITSILGYSQLLLSDETGTLPPMHHQIIGRIERNGRRLLGLIEDTLTMSQVEVGNFHFDRRPVDLRAPLVLALETVHPALAANSVTIQPDVASEPIRVFGDTDKLERVFTNLLSNAAKFSHKGDTIVASLRAEGDEAVFRVTDTGLGISLEDQAFLFDRFFRGEDAHALAIQGVGLGLPIAHSIVEGHDGRIDVASELGKGSTFVVRIPLLTAEQELAHVNGVPTDVPAGPPAAGAAERAAERSAEPLAEPQIT